MDTDAPSGTTKSSANAPRETFAELYLRRLVNRRRPVMRAARGHWYCAPQELNPHLLDQAIHGLTSLGLYAVSTKGLSKWCCLDTDNDAETKKLLQLVDRLVEADAMDHLLLEQSRRGYHLWAFFRPPIAWESARAYGQALARTVDLDCEVYPKGGGLHGVRAPGSRHPQDGRSYPLINLRTWLPEADNEEVIRLIQPLDAPTIALPETVPPRILERRDPTSGLYHLETPSRQMQHIMLVTEVNRYTMLRYIGPEKLQGLCPFHDDRNPSFGITGAYWQCFARCLGEGRSHGGLNAFRARMREKGL